MRPRRAARRVARIVVTDALAEAGLGHLRGQGHEVTVCSADDPAVTEAEAWIVRSATRIDAAALARAPRLRAVGRAGVGVDNIDLAAATQQGVAVFNAPTGNITSAAEQAWALMLAAARHVPEADRTMKAGEWARGRLRGVELAGKSILVVGLGRIGRMMAARARAFEMRVLGHDPYVAPEQARADGVEWVGLDDGLARADVVTLHTPLTPQTRGLIDAGRLACMPPHAILVNAARGPLVDGDALLDALEGGRLRAAALDVWPEEPPTDWRLARHPRVVAAPHLGASTEEAQAKAAIQVCERVSAFLATADAGLAVNAQAGVDAATRPWAALAEALAAFAAQAVDGALRSVTVEATQGLDVDALEVHALVGALRTHLDPPVNAINAPGLAKERGLAVGRRSLPQEGGPARVRVVMVTDQGRFDIEGTVTPHYGARATRIDDYEIEFRPQGRFLLTRHDDVPGVLAAITRILADDDVNVAMVSLARDAARGDALAVIQVDGGIPQRARDALRRIGQVREAHRIRLDVPGSGPAGVPQAVVPPPPVEGHHEGHHGSGAGGP